MQMLNTSTQLLNWCRVLAGLRMISNDLGMSHTCQVGLNGPWSYVNLAGPETQQSSIARIQKLGKVWYHEHYRTEQND